MKPRSPNALLKCALAVALIAGTPWSSAAPRDDKPDVLLATMQQELQRAQSNLAKLDPAPYFLSYAVYDQDTSVSLASEGGLLSSNHLRKRTVDVVVRTGSLALDNTHGNGRGTAISSGVLPLTDDRDAIAHELWRLTYEQYRKSSKSFLNIKTGKEVQAQEEDTSPDFSQEPAQSHADYRNLPPGPDQKVLDELTRKYSSYLRQYRYIQFSMVSVTVQNARMHYVSSEGTHVVVPNTVVRLVIQAQCRADDGMDLMRVETFQAESVDHLPPQSEIAARAEKMAKDLEALLHAPLAEPFDGPALLSGRASAVFFHEVLGHRLEGHRQRGEQEGQTFTKKVNQSVLPAFLSVADDPTLRTMNGVDLGGWYQYDDEGMPAERVEVIQDGILRNFLMSRMPVKNFGNSNGHGRAQPGLMPTGRQGNLIVTSSNTVKDADLRGKLIEEVKKQNKPYGLYFEDIQGGFTLTQRLGPQAFEVLPVLVWRVYPDGRPDELVRGVDIVGTPLAALSRILLTGDKTEVFNGLCGAESGFVPVAAAAPAILFSDLEVQKRAHSLNRTPVMPKPEENPKPPAKSDSEKD